MEKLENIQYGLLNYTNYSERIRKLLCDERLIELGVNRQVLGKSVYGYDIDCITLGNGDKHLFLVGGTHGSEMIGVDFVTQLIGEVGNFSNFDPNEFKLFIIPLQNPEGFVVSTDSLLNVESDFQGKSYEYYLRYKIDNIIVYAIRDFNKFVKNVNSDKFLCNWNVFLKEFQHFFNTNMWWKKLCEMIEGVDRFIFQVQCLENIDNYTYLRRRLIEICDSVRRYASDTNNLFLLEFMTGLRNDFESSEIIHLINDKNFMRFHQDMFKSVGFDHIHNIGLSDNIRKMYDTHSHPLGSQVTFDATGVGINLNANHKLNPGIDAIKNRKEVFGVGARNNIHNYVPGPLGVPCNCVYCFEYAPENKILYDLIKKSYDSGNYVGTILFHGTGGLIYYEPFQGLMDDKEYHYYSLYNKNMASIYEMNTGYRFVNSGDTTGYGDLLRRTFPGVLMIELSKMGGNPIAPYGDKNNIYNTFKDNFKAIDSLLDYFYKINKQDNKVKKYVK